MRIVSLSKQAWLSAGIASFRPAQLESTPLKNPVKVRPSSWALEMAVETWGFKRFYRAWAYQCLHIYIHTLVILRSADVSVVRLANRIGRLLEKAEDGRNRYEYR